MQIVDADSQEALQRGVVRPRDRRIDAILQGPQVDVVVPCIAADGADYLVSMLRKESDDLLHARHVWSLDVVRQFSVCIEHRVKKYVRAHDKRVPNAFVFFAVL